MAAPVAGGPVMGFPLWFVLALPVLWPAAKARDWWVLNGYKVTNRAHEGIDKVANKLYDLCSN